MAMSVDEDGALTDVLGTWGYANESAVHGIDVVQMGGQTIIFSADTKGNAVWGHRFDVEAKRATEVFKVSMPRADMHPRHLVSHSNGNYLYVVMEAANSIVSYPLADGRMGPAEHGQEFNLIPDG
jgi:carboxy-cis,cis-muconate cyclase